MKLSTGSKVGVGVGTLLLLLALSGGLLGCAGPTARKTVLLPAIFTAWPSVKVNVEAGGVFPADLTRFDQALQEADRVAMVASWVPIRRAAVRGIRVRLTTAPPEISPGVAAVLVELVNKFDMAISELKY